MTAAEILCFGEILWDALPDGPCLGGAPFNVAAHLRALGRPAAIASRVGDDDAGRRALDQLRQRGLSTDLVQIDPQLATGAVDVRLGPTGEPTYAILEPAAWDAIRPDPALLRRAAGARALVFGTLAQRHGASRSTLRRLLGCAAGTRVLDVNLRPPHLDPAVVEASLRAADLVKLNRDELETLSGWFDLGDDERARATALARRFGCREVCVTRGAHGAALWRPDGFWERPGEPVEVVDTVGAGDAFLAALLDAGLRGQPPVERLASAVRCGAAAAARRGALP